MTVQYAIPAHIGDTSPEVTPNHALVQQGRGRPASTRHIP